MSSPSQPSAAPDLMLPNPGGLLALGHVLYRDDFIAALWRVLAQRSARIESERRGGKTSILRKMAAEHAPEWLPVYLEVSGVQSPDEFTDKLFHCLAAHRSGWDRFASGVRGFFVSISRFKLFGYEFGLSASATAWKGRVEGLLRHVAHRHPDRKVVLLLDELPSMLENLAKAGDNGAAEAMAVLNLLRELRQGASTGPRLRMVYAGSVGLHHVLRRLREAGHPGLPVNDMDAMPVPPLGPSDAAALAQTLIANSGVALAEAAACPTLAASTGGFPYYIHHVVSRLVKDGSPVTCAAVEQAIQDFLTDPLDPWNMLYFLTRIEGYYPAEGPAARAILDRLADAPGPLPAADLTAAATAGTGVTADRARGLLESLALDHYISQNHNGTYGFQFPILRRWWRLKRN